MRHLIGVLILIGLLVPDLASSQVVQSHQYVPGEVIVKLKGKSRSVYSQAFIGKMVSVKSASLKGSWQGLNVHHFAFSPARDVDSMVQELSQDPDVEYVEPNYIVHRESLGVEGNVMSLADVQAMAGVSASSTSYQQSAAAIQVPQAWTAMTSGLTQPVVAVIDTGLDLTHSVFVNSGAIWTNTGETASNGIDDDGNGYIDDVRGWNFVARSNNPQDDDGHGTHVAGIILGIGTDIKATTMATAPFKIMPLKFLDSNGSGTTSDAISAIYYAVNKGANVINNSWGGGGFSQSLLDALVYAYNQKRTVICAAGNATNNNDASPTYPASYVIPGMLTIAATTDWDTLASFSNYGASSVHLAGPGVSILSTLPGGTFGYSSGTSMAAPMISGVAAMILREKPTMTPYQVRSLIESNGQSVTSLASKTSTGRRTNVYNSVVSAKAASVDSTQPSYSASSNRAPAGAAAAASSGGGAAGGCGLVRELTRGGGSSGMQNVTFFGVLFLLIMPIAVSLYLRNRDTGRRKHTRYNIESQVRVKFGDRELVGTVSTISLGGVQLNTDAWLEQGGIVAMKIRSPDGSQEIDVEGKIVWSEEQKHYGVQFAKAERTTLEAIRAWTKSLSRAA